MISLLIDTSDHILAVGLFKDSECIASFEQEANRKTSELLIPTIDALLNETSLTIKEIEAIVVACGPGSYTGIRIGISFVKTLLVVLPNIKVYTVSSLQASCGLNSGVVFSDAKSKRVYLSHSKKGALTQPVITPLKSLSSLEGPFYGDRTLLINAITPDSKLKNIMDAREFWKLIEQVDTLSPTYIS